MMDYAKYRGYLATEDEAADGFGAPWPTDALLSRYDKPLTAALFIERQDVWKESQEERGISPLYTLGEREQQGVLSAYQIYMNSVDEFEAAMKLVGSLYHWQALCTKSWFMEVLKDWRSHMALRDYSFAKRAILKDVKGGDGPAARKLLEMAAKVINPPEPKKPKQSQPENPEEDGDLAEMFRKHILG